MRKLFTMALVAGFLPLVASAASARTYKWCINGPGDTPRCHFDTLKQCMASASGRGADCSVNPKLTSDSKKSPKSYSIGR
ncbi:DUF3551 domain-containing protein [Tardiphaga sp. 866_E4_N1_4]